MKYQRISLKTTAAMLLLCRQVKLICYLLYQLSDWTQCANCCSVKKLSRQLPYSQRLSTTYQSVLVAYSQDKIKTGQNTLVVPPL